MSIEYRFLTLTERRKVCSKLALLNAHSKFLSVSQDQWMVQSEWKLRLNLGARGSWSGCLDNARIIDVFYDIMDSCRVVVWYDCDPRDY